MLCFLLIIRGVRVYVIQVEPFVCKLFVSGVKVECKSNGKPDLVILT